LLGNLGGDPELRYTAKGTQMVSFNVAVNQIRKGPDGERQESTEWFRIQVTGPKVEYVSRFVKGNRVLVVGRLNISHYTAKTGEARTGYDVWADEVESMTPRPRDPETLMEGEPEAAEPAHAGVSSLAGAGAPRAAAAGAARGRPANGRGQSTAGSEDLEDLPF
jgi:single-strand DNA-binding protein